MGIRHDVGLLTPMCTHEKADDSINDLKYFIRNAATYFMQDAGKKIFAKYFRFFNYCKPVCRLI